MRHMARTSAKPAQADAAAVAHKRLLRLLTCGSVDDGKSTLIGRLLFDCKLLREDELADLAMDSARFGTMAGLDMALLVDGLRAEREQGITIDVAYRHFATQRRRFLVADTPGHEQYTRNMATGASTAELAILLIDARKGLLAQTRRHSHIVALLGIRNIVVAVNKMDAIAWDRAHFAQIKDEYLAFAAGIGLANVLCIPMCALHGDNVTRRSAAMPWYEGPTLLEHLETVEVSSGVANQPFRMPVQWVNRPDSQLRGYCGTVVSGSVRPGDRLAILPGGATASVKRIVTFHRDLDAAVAGQAVMLTLVEDGDISRGDVLAADE